ncbi:MAG: TIGR00295 family protein [Candidatus Altiarchaeota archaeon]|nr:TIGR00295 family protein [Candidatus Altiarchaeota archaeon]
MGCDERLFSHLNAVSRLAREIAERILDKGHEIDVDFVEVAALLHDIGRTRTHGIRHGIEGAAILRNMGLERYARVCETHIGAGLTKEEAKSLGLPERDYLPETLEEKVIAHADNLIEESRRVPIDKTIKRLKERLGEGHPAVERVKALNDFIVSLS